MTHEEPTTESPPDPPKPGPWPWGQTAFLLAGVPFCLMELTAHVAYVRASFRNTFENLMALPMFAAIICGGYAFYLSTQAGSDEAHPQRIPWLRYANVSVWCLLFGLMLSRILFPGTGASDKAGGAVVTTRDGRFTIEVPDGWVDISGQLSAKIEAIAFRAPTDDVFVAIVTDRREDLTIRSLEDYVQTIINGISADLPDFKILESTSSSVPGRPTKEFIAGATKDGSKLSFVLQFYETPQHFVHLRVRGAPSAFRDNEPSLRAILASFREVTPNR